MAQIKLMKDRIKNNKLIKRIRRLGVYWRFQQELIIIAAKLKFHRVLGSKKTRVCQAQASNNHVITSRILKLKQQKTNRLN